MLGVPATPTAAPRRDIATRLAGSALLARLPAPVRTPFAVNNLIYFSGNLFAGLAGFAFQDLLAGALGADQFAEVATLISIFYLIQVALFVAMAAAARYTAPLAARGEHEAVSRAYRDLTVYAETVGFAGMFVFILLSPLIKSFLHMPGLGPLIALSATVPLTLLVGVGRGVVQGEERFVPLSLNFIVYGFTTLVFLPVLLGFHLHAVGAVLAINLALVLCNLAAALALRNLPRGSHHPRLHIGRVLRSSIGATAGIAAITVFYNGDVLFAKHFLSTGAAGRYSAMSLLGKILFFGTISVSAVMFPRVAALHAEGKSALKLVDLSLGLVLAIGGAITAVYWLFPRIVIVVLLRHKDFLDIAPYIGIFGLAMLGLALANVLVYYFIAVHRRRFVFGILVGAVAFVGLLGYRHADLGEFTTSVTAAIDLMAVVLVAIYIHDRRSIEARYASAATLAEG